MFYNHLTPEEIDGIASQLNSWSRPKGYSYSDQLARILIDTWHAESVANNLDVFHDLSSDVWVDLVNLWYEDCIESCGEDWFVHQERDSFTREDRDEIQRAMNKKAEKDSLWGVVENEPEEEPLTIWECEEFIKIGYWMYVIENWDKIAESDRDQVIKMLCDAWYKEDLEWEIWEIDNDYLEDEEAA